MLFTAALISALAVATSATPISKRALTDTDILQYALTLEHLENNFYMGALGQFDEAAFEAAGFPSWVRGRVSQISEHEASHVAVLAGALGSAATQPCNYSFPYTDPASFLALSQVIENVGVSAYLGAASSITEAAYVTVAGSILTTEARHQAWIAAASNKMEPWSGPYDTPLGPSDVYSIAAAFITGCPSSNPALPVKAFPAATIPAGAMPGDNVKVTFPTTGQTEYMVVYSGLATAVAPIAADSTFTIPAGLQGISYGVITTQSNVTMISDDNTVAGPVILNFPFGSDASNPMFTGM